MYDLSRRAGNQAGAAITTGLRHLHVMAMSGAILVAGCSGTPPLAVGGAEAYKLVPPPADDAASQNEYQIGPLDVLTISVFQEEDLSFEEVPVDASGNITFPLIGQIQAAGKSSAEVSKLMATRLGERFLVNPQVTVLIKTSVSQKVTVDGAVTEPGVYALQGETTLIQSVALAKGTSSVAKLDEVIVFRIIDGERHAAMFNLDDIRKGRAPDPRIRANDTVVVGLSRAKLIFRDVVAVAPALATGFVALNQISQ